jgi:hypothetical protein
MATVNIYDMADTWTVGGTTYTAIKMNVTDTASAAASLLMDLQVGGTSKFAISKTGVPTWPGTSDQNFIVQNGTPLLRSSDSATGLYSVVSFASGGRVRSQLDAGSTPHFQATNGNAVTSYFQLFGEAAHTLAQRNSTNAQSFRVYNTYTDASNYERLSLRWESNEAMLDMQKAGTGSSRNFLINSLGTLKLQNWSGNIDLFAIGGDSIIFSTNNTNRWQINSSGHFLASTDNTYDIGASGATRPRTIYAGTSVIAAGVNLNVETLVISVSDETTAITAGTAKVTFRMPWGMTVTAVRASLTTASTSGAVTVDINDGGTTIISTKLTIDQDEKTSTTAATPAVISDSALADDAEITIDIDGAGTGAKGLKVYLIGTRL